LPLPPTRIWRGWCDMDADERDPDLVREVIDQRRAQAAARVRREHVQKKFRISSAQASLDLRRTRALWPNLMEYDLSEKIYKAKGSA